MTTPSPASHGRTPSDTREAATGDVVYWRLMDGAAALGYRRPSALARVLGVTAARWDLWRAAGCPPPPDEVVRIAAALDEMEAKARGM